MLYWYKSTNTDAARQAAEWALARGDIAAARAAQVLSLLAFTGKKVQILTKKALQEEYTGEYIRIGEEGRSKLVSVAALTEKIAAVVAAAAAEMAAAEKAAPTVGSAPSFGVSTGGALRVGSAQAFASTGGAFGASVS